MRAHERPAQVRPTEASGRPEPRWAAPQNRGDVPAASGPPLAAGVRSLFEPRLGHDFGRIRVERQPAGLAARTAADAVTNGERFEARERRDDGPPDAGSPGAGLPDAGSPAPTPVPGPGGSPAPAPAPTVSVLRIEVDNPAASITHPVASNLGAGGRAHAVTIASLSGTPTVLRAVVSPSVAATDPSVAGLTWSVNGAPVAASSDPLHAELPRGAAKRAVRASLGGSSAELTVWAVFARITSTIGRVAASDNGSRLRFSVPASFRATILPASIITDADHPALEGPNTVDPPGGTNSCGDPLTGGASLRWDMSRQIRLKNVDPSGLRPTFDRQPGVTACLHTDLPAYPSRIEVGNDDAGTGDENNDPYAGGGVLTSQDEPSNIYPHAVGANGNTIEERVHFREFARLEYRRTWWKLSHFAPWRVHFRARRDAGRWVDDGSTAAADNSGF